MDGLRVHKHKQEKGKVVCLFPSGETVEMSAACHEHFAVQSFDVHRVGLRGGMEDESGVVHGIVLGGGFQLREVEGRAHTVAMVGEGHAAHAVGNGFVDDAGDIGLPV